MLALAVVIAALQQPGAVQGLPAQVADTSPFRRLALPTATLIREGSGNPGPRYWQQRADYTIRASLDTATHTVSGSETIRYANNSPDTLRYLWLQLDQNIYRANSRGAALNPTDARFAGRGFEGGYTIEYVRAVRRSGGQAVTKTALAATVNGTMMRADLDRPLPPGQVATLELSYRFEVPEHGSDRMGREQFTGGWLYEVAQWYPRVAVYDDVRGWNTEQYLGQGEFYLEYGDFDVSITVPRSFVVAATGTLVNPTDVLTTGERARLARAVKSDSTTAIIAKTEAGQPFTRPSGASPTLTWHFTARNVRDVAWAAAATFIWDASGYDGILIQSLYPPEANADWARATQYARHSIKHYSDKWFHYPYPTAINVAGPVGGMEYPMIVFCEDRTGGFDLFAVTTHELGHQWFPMIVGSNERLYAWMDEGFNTFMNIYSIRSFYPDSQWDRHRGDPARWARFAVTGFDQPPLVAADRVNPRLLGFVEYDKPATGLYLLRQRILDDTARFDVAFREYIRRWAYRHPTPADFFRTMEDALGEDLSWFWRGWFYTTDVVDLAVDSVRARTDATGTTAFVFVSSPGRLPMPVDLRLTYGNGAAEDTRLPVEIWFQGNRYVYAHKVPADLIKVEIDPGQNFPDVRRENNVWTKP
ncbi:MAG TPA: M1 family metallopeptidase [Gemmatimonadales bacterium]|nr:M1 family metallopeptidase [Gemmatimonadales bacterium]